MFAVNQPDRSRSQLVSQEIVDYRYSQGEDPPITTITVASFPRISMLSLAQACMTLLVGPVESQAWARERDSKSFERRL